MPAESFSHLNERGESRMVDVSDKPETRRRAVAEAWVKLPAEVAIHFREGDLHGPKGPVFSVARIAGIQAAKRTAEWIPMCHPLPLDGVDVDIQWYAPSVRIVAEARVKARTGVEMEALTAVSAAALTVYDMCKGLSHDIEITAIRLMEKTGGKHEYRRAGTGPAR